MAQPIQFVPSRTDTAEKRDAISSALELLQLLHDRGVLDLLKGMLAAGDHVVDTFTAAIDTPEAIRGIRNFILLTKFFASIPPEVLNSLVQTAVDGAEREKAQHAPSSLQLLRRLGSVNSRHAVAIALDLVEAVGKGAITAATKFRAV
jgi:uncharacterized protein YjgD (DUF1641 family)